MSGGHAVTGNATQWPLLGAVTAFCPGSVLFAWGESTGGEGEF